VEDGVSRGLRAGGFDAVIENPPYLRIQGLQEITKDKLIIFLIVIRAPLNALILLARYFELSVDVVVFIKYV
jgi:hypothetical protein